MNLNPVAAALIAGRTVAVSLIVGASAIAMAAPDKAADKTKVPQTVPATTPPGTVTLDEMDDATQQNLGRGAVNTPPANPGKAATGSGVRDWASIDINNDHSISPGEMEAFLVIAHAKSAGK